MNFQIAATPDLVTITAGPAGLQIHPKRIWDLADKGAWPGELARDRSFAPLALEVEAILESGLGAVAGTDVLVPWKHWDDLVQMGLEFPRHWLDWSPFLLSIDSIGSIGREDFRYIYRFLLGSQEVLLERIGAIVKRARQEPLYMLDPQSFALVEAMDAFNAAPIEERTGPDAWLRFSEVKGCAKAVGAQLDEYLVANDVVVPGKVGLTVVEKKDGSVSFLPRCAGVPRDAFERAFLKSREDQSLYMVDGENGKRVKVVLGKPQREALKAMRRVQNVRGKAGERLRTQPDLAFEGLLNQMEVAYSRRVEGIGDWRPLPMPKGPTGESLLEIDDQLLGETWDAGAEEEALGMGRFKVPVDLELADAATGLPVRVALESQPEARAFLGAMHQAQAAGDQTFPFRGRRFSVDPGLDEALRGKDGGQTSSEKKFLLIYTDEEETKEEDVRQAAEAVAATGPQSVYEAPDSLDPAFPLKPHQEDAVAWLQACSRLIPARRGVLLADEMGLGKTLEVLTFLAWCLERGVFPGLGSGPGPFRPVLVVAPLMLVENETWQGDMGKFFHAGTFGPVLSLHGETLQAMRLGRGRETEVGRPLLDLDSLQRHRIVITNYETITNFQHSLAQVRDGRSIWSVVVTDEAQEFKNPQSRISHAIKALHPDFHIACTGTPVENRLIDLWNLFDALQPSLLGSAREFKAKFEVPVEQEGDGEALADLREALHYQRPQAFLLRREKTILPGFPQKRERLMDCAMGPQESERHIRLLKALKQADKRRGLHLSYLHRLVELYQHPLAHREDFDHLDITHLLSASPKLQRVIEELRDIQAKGEKALIFARHIKIQRMLARVLEATFGLPVSIINGTTGRGNGAEPGEPVPARQQRARILDRFRHHQGFHVLILSPFVAGVGLTITEANHVIHYGRWWNPAVESQATDRVYRIGQTRDVEVHLPILRDPLGRLSASFDERLHQLLERKRGLARDFLTPRPSEQDLEREFCEDLVQEAEGDKGPELPLTQEEVRQLPGELLEAWLALALEQNDHQVDLGEPRRSGGLTLVARKDAETLLVRLSDHQLPARQAQDAHLLEEIAWPGGKITRVLASRRSVQTAQNLGRVRTLSIEEISTRWPVVCTEFDLLERTARRSPLRPPN